MTPPTMMSARSALSPRILRRFRADTAARRSRTAVTSEGRRRRPCRSLRRPRAAARCMLAMVRTVPPMPMSSSPRRVAGRTSSSCSRTARRSRRNSFEVGGSCLKNWRVTRTAPRGALLVERISPRRTRLSCRLPPPRSAMAPSVMGRLRRAATAPRRASWRPLRISTSTPSLRSSGPSRRRLFSASRTAAVATAITRGSAPLRTSRRKRWAPRSTALTPLRGSVPGLPPASRVTTRVSLQHPVAGARDDAGEHEAGGVGADVEHRHQLRQRLAPLTPRARPPAHPRCPPRWRRG